MTLAKFVLRVPEPLIKAQVKMKPVKTNLGTWQGLKVIAIGPKGGKIVGYRANGKPIYAGSKAAQSLASAKKEKAVKKEKWTPQAKDKALMLWFKDLGLTGAMAAKTVTVSPEVAELLAESFGVPHSKLNATQVSIDKADLFEHLGEPLKPSGESQTVWAAKMAAGAEDVMPDLTKLTEIPAGKYAGSHGNRAFKDEQGKIWIFKDANPIIARAEEAANRIGRLVLGDQIPWAEYVQVEGKDGVLLEHKEGKEITTTSHSKPSLLLMADNAEDVVKHQVVDWLISNHDAHAGNFLADKKAGKLNGIDKGQAWKWIGNDKLDGKFKGDNPSDPIYKTFWDDLFPSLSEAEKASILTSMRDAIEATEKITPKQLEVLVGPYVATVTGWTGGSPQTLTKKMVDRLNSIRSDFQNFLKTKGLTLPDSEHKDNFETMPEVDKDEAKWAAVGVLSSSKYTNLINAGFVPKWPEDVLDTDEVDPNYGVGPLPGYKAKQLKEKGLVVVKEGAKAPKLKEKLVITQPEAPKVLKEEAKPVPTAEPTPGWPIKKGSPKGWVTVNQPGGPHPGGKWKKGIPGPGYNALVTYKGKDYEIAIEGPDDGGKPIILVKFPDGKILSTASLNVAGDWLYLFHNGLDLNLTGTQKKEKGISLGSKVFKVKDFQKEIAAANAGGEVDPIQMDVKELEDAQVVSPEQKMLSQFQILAGEPDGVVDADKIPAEIDEFITENTVPVGKDYSAQIKPGVAVKVTTPQGEILVVAAKVDEEGEPSYKLWNKDESTEGVGWELLDTHWNFKSLPGVEVPTQDVPQTIQEKQGSSPKAELPKEAKVPENAKPTSKGPMSPGSKITVKKKGLGLVTLEIVEGEDGKLEYHVMFTDKENVEQYKIFNSLSAASDHVWVSQKGYITADWYKQVNNTNKVPSGGGWKFWGLKTKPMEAPKPPPETAVPEVVPEPAPEVTPELTPSAPNWESFKPVKTELVFKDITTGMLAGMGDYEETGVQLTWEETGPVKNWGLRKIGDNFSFFRIKDGEWIQTGSYYVTEPEKVLAEMDPIGGVVELTNYFEPDEPVAELKYPYSGKAWKKTTLDELAVSDIGKMKELTSSLVWLEDGKKRELSKDGDGYSVTEFEGGGAWGLVAEYKTPSQALAAINPDPGTGLVYQKMKIDPVVGAPEPTKLDPDVDWDVEPTKPVLADFQNAAIGTRYRAVVEELNTQEYVKTGDDEWTAVTEDGELMDLKFESADALEAVLNFVDYPPNISTEILKYEPVSEELAEAAATMPVVKMMSVQQALENHEDLKEGKLSIKPAKKGEVHYVCYDGVDNAAEILNSVMVDIGIDQHMKTKNKYPKTNAQGAFTALSSDVLNDTLAVELPADVADKVQEGPPKKPKKPKKPEKSAEDVTAEKEKKKKAKELAEWTKKNPSVSDEKDLFVLAHFQNQYGKYDLEPGTYAKKSGKSVLLGHKETPGKFAEMLGELGVKGKWVKSPVGNLFKTSIKNIQNVMPKELTATVVGPDNKEYPAGTKFEEKTTEHTAKDLLPSQPGFHKIVEHKSDPNLMLLKVSGNGATQMQQMKDMTKELNLESPFPEPKAGQSNIINIVTKASVEKVVKTETNLVVKQPLSIPSFVQASTPGTSTGKLWQEVGDNRDDLVALDTIKIPYFGHQVRMGAPGVLRNFGLKVRKIKQADGKMVYEFSGDLAYMDNTKTSDDLTKTSIPFLSAAGTKEDVTGWTVHSYDEEGGYHDESKAGGVVETEYGLTGSTAGGSKIELIDEGNTYRGHFRVRVAEGADMEAELGEAFQKMGHSPENSLARTNEDTDRIFKKMSLVKSGMGAQGWSYDHDFDHSRAHDEAYLDEKIKQLKLKKYLKGAKIQSVFQGNSTAIIDDADRFKKAGWQFPYVGASLDGAFMNVIQGAGWASRKERYVMGSYGASQSMMSTGQSASSDIACGGAQGTFFRIASDSVNVSPSYDVKMIAKPKLFKRADWWRYDTDAFGTTSTNSPGQGSISSTKKRTSTVLKNKNNEIIFEHGVAVEDFIGMAVSSESKAEYLKESFKKKGITEINGKSLDEFIKVVPNVGPTTKQVVDAFNISPEDWE